VLLGIRYEFKQQGRAHIGHEIKNNINQERWERKNFKKKNRSWVWSQSQPRG